MCEIKQDLSWERMFYTYILFHIKAVFLYIKNAASMTRLHQISLKSEVENYIVLLVIRFVCQVNKLVTLLRDIHKGRSPPPHRGYNIGIIVLHRVYCFP